MCATVVVLTVSCTGTSNEAPPSPLPSGPQTLPAHASITELRIEPVPEGPSMAFKRDAQADRMISVLPLDRVEEYIPGPLPSPLDQPGDCELGGNLVVSFSDGSDLTYGPCERPASVDQLWAGMVFAYSKGQCLPRCGPDGELPPQTGGSALTMTWSQPQMRSEDWQIALLMAAHEKACLDDPPGDLRAKNIQSFPGLMIVTNRCRDGTLTPVTVMLQPRASRGGSRGQDP